VDMIELFEKFGFAVALCIYFLWERHQLDKIRQAENDRYLALYKDQSRDIKDQQDQILLLLRNVNLAIEKLERVIDTLVKVFD